MRKAPNGAFLVVLFATCTYVENLLYFDPTTDLPSGLST